MTAKKTLTQRRSKKSSSQIKPNNISRLQPQSLNNTSVSNTSQDSGSVVKIFIWAIIILVTGIGLAMLVRNMTNKQDIPQDTETTTSQNTILLDTSDTDKNDGIVIDTDTTKDEDNTEDMNASQDDEENDDSDTTQEDESPTGSNLTNEFSQKDQYINDGLTTNTITIAGYSYANYSSYFAYHIKLSNADKFPKVTASLNETENTLTVVVENVQTDQIVGNGGTGETTFNGADNTTSVDISNSNNKTTFIFHLNTIKDYRIFAQTGDPNKIIVEIKN